MPQDDLPTRHEGPRVLAVPLLVAALTALLVVAFAWPSARSGPRDVPLVVAGPPAATAPVVQQLQATWPGAFDVREVPDEQAARKALAEREAYGALVLIGPGQPPVLLTASAAGPAVAQLLTGAAVSTTSTGGTPAGAARVVDVAPAGDGDPRGGGLAAAALPLALGGMLTGLLSVTLLSGVRARLTAVALSAVAGAATATGLLHGWLGVLPDDPSAGRWWASAGLLSLLVGAVATTLVGLHGLAGRAGLGLGAATMFALGNPLSAAASAPELLPDGWGTLGQLLPPGAGISGLRGTAFFDGAGTTRPLVVLSSWLAAGLLLLAVAALREQRRRRRHRDEHAVRSTAAERVPAHRS